jgi:hypothetical protein
MTDKTLDRIRALDPVTDDDRRSAASNREQAWQNLLARTAHESADAASPEASVGAAAQPARGEWPPSGRRPRRTAMRRVVPALVAASLIGGIAITAYERSGNSRTEALGPALAFADNGSRVTITIVDLQADADRFNRELQEHRLKFKLALQPVTPSIAGQITAEFGGDGNQPGDLTVGETPAGCEVGGPAPCHITISVAKDYHGEGELVIGRPLRPGEEAMSHADLGAKGEPLAGIRYQGQQVGQVRELLRQRGLTVREYEVSSADRNETRATVPDQWIVRGGMVVTDTETRLIVGPK